MQYPTIAQPQYGFAPTMPMMPSMSDMPPAMMAKGGLASAAQNVQAQGRNGDSMLVHMTPREVGGLQALAMQHGGSLTVNPRTGLPEASFLKNLLPTLAGAALMIGSGGAINPLTAGLIVGGGTTVATGDLSKGLMAGLGAYGGAGLGAGLSAAGASTAAVPTATAAGPTFDYVAGAGLDAGNIAATSVNPATSAALTPQTTIAPTLGDTGAAIYGGAPSPAMQAANLGVDEMASLTGDSSRILTGSGQTAPTIMDRFAQAGRGVENLFTQEGAFERFIGQAGTKADEKKGVEAVQATGLGGPMGALKTTAMAGAPFIADAMTPEPVEMPGEEKSNYKGPYKPSERRVSYPDDDLRRRTSEFMYFSPSNPIPYAEGGETSGSDSADVAVSPNEAKVYQDIMNVQRLAGLPSINPNRFAVMPARSYEQFVYNPIQAGPVMGGVGPERDYGFAPLMSKEEAEEAVSSRNESGNVLGRVGSMMKGLGPTADNEIVGYTGRGEPIYAKKPDEFSKGGVPQLENGGFVLTKKAVDGLGSGSNKKGQQVASRGLGAIPLKGEGAKRGPKFGVDDKIKTSIEGKRPALVSNGEAYVPKKQVEKHGGAKKFYALMSKAEKAAEKRKRA